MATSFTPKDFDIDGILPTFFDSTFTVNTIQRHKILPDVERYIYAYQGSVKYAMRYRCARNVVDYFIKENKSPTPSKDLQNFIDGKGPLTEDVIREVLVPKGRNPEYSLSLLIDYATFLYASLACMQKN